MHIQTPSSERQDQVLKEAERHHLISLPEGSWALWRTVVLRGAGIPADRVLRLSDPALGACVERYFELEGRVQKLHRDMLRAANETLNELRHSGRWDTDLRKRSMRALQRLNRNKLPKAAWDEASSAALEALYRAHSELESALAPLAEIYRACRDESSRELATVADWDLFREAVTWQNRDARHNSLERLRRSAPSGSSNRPRRKREETVASYLQRYCVKNDTIGFFGPVGWASLVDGEEAFELRPGRQLLARRQVYFENWCIAALARKLARDPVLAPWLIPRLRSSLSVEGSTLHRVFGPPVRLSLLDRQLITACDGRRTARQVAEHLMADPDSSWSTPEAVDRHLRILVKKRFLTWGLDLPLERHPERTLRRLLLRIEPQEPRARALAVLEEIEAGRCRVAEAAGCPEALDERLQELEKTFTRLCGESAQRYQGQTYAGRGLVYEDCRRDVELKLGGAFLRPIGAPLSLLLDAGRWLAGELTRRVRSRLETIYEELAQKNGSSTISSTAFFHQALSSIFLRPERDPGLREVEREYQARWAELLTRGERLGNRTICCSARELEGRAAELFGAAGPAWQLARHLCPDVMIAASDPGAVERGDFDAIVGEIHAGNTIFASCLIAQHPAPQELYNALAADVLAPPVVVPFWLKENGTQRININLQVPEFYRYDAVDVPPGSEAACRPIPAASVVVEKNGHSLRARTRDGRLRFDAIELFGFHLNQELSSMIGRILPPVGHQPRVMIDRVVAARERWDFRVEDLELPEAPRSFERFLEVRRWARRQALPRFSFYKLSFEKKPFYIDFESPIYVDLFTRALLQADRVENRGATLTLTEMAPRIDQTWLTDGEGQRYTCELRIAAVHDPPARRGREAGR